MKNTRSLRIVLRTSQTPDKFPLVEMLTTGNYFIKCTLVIRLSKEREIYCCLNQVILSSQLSMTTTI